MHEQIVDQIKKYIAETSYVVGYIAALNDVKRIIDLAESLHSDE